MARGVARNVGGRQPQCSTSWNATGRVVTLIPNGVRVWIGDLKGKLGTDIETGPVVILYHNLDEREEEGVGGRKGGI